MSHPAANGSVNNDGVDGASGGSKSSVENGGGIDEVLYSRQIYVLGKEAMTRMASSNVLISGMGGLGVEVAKNVILGGVKSVTIQDTKATRWEDMATQYYLKECDVGKNRATQSLKSLAELNRYVVVKETSEPLTPELIVGGNFRTVVVTDGAASSEDLKGIAQFCHDKGIYFILADSRGVFSRVFCDFGEDFVVNDVNGENPTSTMIAEITQEEEGFVTCLIRHGLDDNDLVTFSEVQGMEELNGCEPVRIQVTGPYTFKLLKDTRELTGYARGGVVTQVKMPKKLKFKSLKDAMSGPECLVTDYAKMDSPVTLNVAFQALDSFVDTYGRRPAPWNQEDAKVMLSIAEPIAKANEVEISAKLIKIFSYVCSGQTIPVNGVVGGVVAQEVMKSVSGKFNPIFQWMFFDAIECLHNEFNDDGSPKTPVDELEFQGGGTRYDGQIAIFGKRYQELLGAQKYFVVGAGAIGCELLKNFAMMGIGATDGKVVVTDMDRIERSNLNRQFLFRDSNVGQAKSLCAANAVKEMNPSINVEYHENRVGPETENVYDDTFFEQLSGVANALDNADARIYMDQRCVYYKKPLLESGTLGTKGNSQVVIPHLTESYSSSADPPEKGTHLSSFLTHAPYSVEHTLQWAREMFEDTFKQSAENAAAYLRDPRFMKRTLKRPGSQPLKILGSVHKCLIADRPANFEDCVKWARLTWEENFNNTIQQVLLWYPPDLTTSTGQLFWSGLKRCPRALKFDLEDPTCVDFVYAAANLRADMYGIPQVRDRDQVATLAIAVEVPEFVPHLATRIAVTDAEAQIQGGNVESNRLDKLKSSIPSAESFQGLVITPLEFEKDNDSNLHIDFIVAASNSRAMNYSIAPADRLKSKLIAGKIIPAIATTSSVVSGLVGLELIKLVHGMTKLERFKNGFVNLALPFFGFSEPISVPKKKYYDQEWTLWDRFEVSGNMTLQEFLDYFTNEHHLEITMLTHGVRMLYSFFTSQDQRVERLKMPLIEVAQRVSKRRIEPHVKHLFLDLCCDDTNGENVEVPYVRYEIPTPVPEAE